MLLNASAITSVNDSGNGRSLFISEVLHSQYMDEAQLEVFKKYSNKKITLFPNLTSWFLFHAVSNPVGEWPTNNTLWNFLLPAYRLDSWRHRTTFQIWWPALIRNQAQQFYEMLFRRICHQNCYDLDHQLSLLIDTIATIRLATGLLKVAKCRS